MSGLLAVAPLGPVVTGRAVVSRFVVSALREAGVAVAEANIGPRSHRPAARLLRPLRFLAAIARLLALRGRRVRAVYVAVDAGAGMWLTAAVVAVARLVGARVALHHHAYGYLADRTLRAACLLTIAGPQAINIVNCPSMKEQLTRRYGVRSDRGLVLSNVVTVEPGPTPPAGPGAGTAPGTVLGFLSNLTFEKGLADAIATTVAVAAQLPATRMLLAGPCAQRAVRSYLRAALRRHPGRIEYLGPLGPREKVRFFKSIDVFVFPSRYRHETQGVVNFEALAHGVPIVARQVGCIGEDFHDAPGVLVARSADFVRSASDAIVRLVEGDGLHAQQRAARRHFDLQRRQAQSQLDRLLATMAGLAE